MVDDLGNRGLCAGPCRLPYSLFEGKNKLDKGYLLSPRDLSGTHFLPELIKAGVNCFKIEGRLKNPEYVGIVTKYYRNLIDIVYNNLDKSNEELLKLLIKEENKINPETSMTYLDELKQSFNRGGFSNGHLSNNPNKNLVYKELASNTGFYLGKVQKFNSNKGYITLKLESSLGIGDKININSDNYTISELMINSLNVKSANIGDIVTIGRIKGNIKPNQKLFKIQTKKLNDYISPTFKEDKEFKQIPIDAIVNIKRNCKISLEIIGNETKVTNYLDIIPEKALTSSITEEKIIFQISKTGNTPFKFENIKVNLDDGLFVSIKTLNELRRISLYNLQEEILKKEIYSRNLKFKENSFKFDEKATKFNGQNKISLLLNILNKNIDYTNYLNGINKLYIPLKYFILDDFKEQINNLSKTFNLYIYMPNILRDKFKIDFDKIINKFNIKGFVISSISQIDLLKKYNLDLIGNYTLNVYNQFTIRSLEKLGINVISITPELNNYDTKTLIEKSSIPLELFVYGKIPLMTMNYCLLGKSNKCYKDCFEPCKRNQTFYLKDRLNFEFRVLPDNIFNLTQIFNSKITSFDYSNFNTEYLRISIIDETPEEIKEIISNVNQNISFKGNSYCSHFNKQEQIKNM